MKIALYGPMTVNLAAGLVKLGCDSVTLYLDDRTVALRYAFRDHPLITNRSTCKIGPWASRSAILAPHNAPITRELAKHDFAILSDIGPIFGQASRIPYAFWPAGMDLTITPFSSRAISYAWRSPRSWAKRTLLAHRQAQGIRASAAVWCAPLPFFLGALARLSVHAPPRYLALPVDTRTFHPSGVRHRDSQDSGPLKVFHPSRLLPALRRIDVATGNVKGNETLLSAMQILMSERADVRISLILQGNEDERSRLQSLVARYGVQDAVTWLRPAELGYTWDQMSELYRNQDLTAVDFASGWFGNVALEAAACAKPVMLHLNEDLPHSAQFRPPFSLASSPEQIAAQVMNLRDPELRRARGAEARKWVLEHHAPVVVAERAKELIQHAQRVTQ